MTASSVQTQQNGSSATAHVAGRTVLHDGDDHEDSDDEKDSTETRAARKKMSSLSRFFISAAVFHACAVVAFQSAILGLGDFSADCEGGLGFDRKIYAILFISAMVYVIVLVVWALYSENIVEIYAFCVIQLLSISYSCTQVFQFFTSRSEFKNRQPNSVKLENYDPPIILAVSNAILSTVMMIFYLYTTYHLYIEFGWKIYTTVPFKAEAKLRGAFRTYQIFTCFLKLEFFFTEMFLLSHVTLLLRDDMNDPEFVASIVAMVLAIVVTIVVYLAVRRENKVIMVIFLLILLAMLGYYSFKFFRFVTKSCRLCQQMKSNVCPLMLISSVPTTAPPNDNLTFEHLSLFIRKMEQQRFRYARQTLRNISATRSHNHMTHSAAAGGSIAPASRTGTIELPAVTRPQDNGQAHTSTLSRNGDTEQYTPTEMKSYKKSVSISAAEPTVAAFTCTPDGSCADLDTSASSSGSDALTMANRAVSGSRGTVSIDTEIASL
ncbi:uncharacterized protein LOC135817076 isoform X2 [Sycon ciliatum]|uniref:uncharacterized protein LOC135817076 isoform X2 n=1 Tax=Sycon ciliatum TaxID=27933 RepID=UPI0031F6F9C7